MYSVPPVAFVVSTRADVEWGSFVLMKPAVSPAPGVGSAVRGHAGAVGDVAVERHEAGAVARVEDDDVHGHADPLRAPLVCGEHSTGLLEAGRRAAARSAAGLLVGGRRTGRNSGERGGARRDASAAFDGLMSGDPLLGAI